METYRDAQVFYNIQLCIRLPAMVSILLITFQVLALPGELEKFYQSQSWDAYQVKIFEDRDQYNDQGYLTQRLYRINVLDRSEINHTLDIYRSFHWHNTESLQANCENPQQSTAGFKSDCVLNYIDHNQDSVSIEDTVYFLKDDNDQFYGPYQYKSANLYHIPYSYIVPDKAMFHDAQEFYQALSDYLEKNYHELILKSKVNWFNKVYDANGRLVIGQAQIELALPEQFNYYLDNIYINRRYQWDLEFHRDQILSNDLAVSHNCTPDRSHVEGNKTRDVYFCRLVIDPDAQVPVKIMDDIIIDFNKNFVHDYVDSAQYLDEDYQISQYKNRFNYYVPDQSFESHHRVVIDSKLTRSCENSSGTRCPLIIKEFDNYNQRAKRSISTDTLFGMSESLKLPRGQRAQAEYWQPGYLFSVQDFMVMLEKVLEWQKQDLWGELSIVNALDYVRAFNFRSQSNAINFSDKQSQKIYEIFHALLQWIVKDHKKDFPDAYMADLIEAYAIALDGFLKNDDLKYLFKDEWIYWMNLLDNYLIREHEVHFAINDDAQPEASKTHESALGQWFDLLSTFADKFPEQVRQNKFLIKWKNFQDDLITTELLLWTNPELKLSHYPFSKWLFLNKSIYNAQKSLENQYKVDAGVIAWLGYHRLFQGSQYIDHETQEKISLMLQTYYLRYTHRDESSCYYGPFAHYCTPITISQYLEPKVYCHDLVPGIQMATKVGLVVRENALSWKDKMQLCEQLHKQELYFFMHMLNAQQPVEDDYNDSLEVVIFKNDADWKLYGTPLYQVNTSNGGLYEEGNASDSNNQARMFVYKISQDNESLNIWNLEHEFTHYLDARFHHYGNHGALPLSLTTWWTEGIAEYLSMAANQQSTCQLPMFNDIREEALASELSLEHILSVSYQHDRVTIYGSSALVHIWMNVESYWHAYWLEFSQILQWSDIQNAEQALKDWRQKIVNEGSEEFALWRKEQLMMAEQSCG